MNPPIHVNIRKAPVPPSTTIVVNRVQPQDLTVGKQVVLYNEKLQLLGTFHPKMVCAACPESPDSIISGHFYRSKSFHTTALLTVSPDGTHLFKYNHL